MMETLKELKAIRDNAKEFNKASASKVKGIKIFDGWYRWFLDDNSYSKIFDNDAFDDVVQIERSLSDIERIIELMETLESFKDKVVEDKSATCAHDGGWVARWDYGICAECRCVKVGTNWGVASRKWFKNLDEAKFYKKNGVLPK